MNNKRSTQHKAVHISTCVMASILAQRRGAKREDKMADPKMPTGFTIILNTLAFQTFSIGGHIRFELGPNVHDYLCTKHFSMT